MSSHAKTYRLCCFDSIQNVLTADWLEADSDEDAIARAEAMGICSHYEIWDGNRLVAEGLSERKQA